MFHADKTTNLITRLRRNVIRTGLRRISLAYSSISLTDVAAKLGLSESADDVECIVAKAIRDGGRGYLTISRSPSFQLNLSRVFLLK